MLADLAEVSGAAGPARVLIFSTAAGSPAAQAFAEGVRAEGGDAHLRRASVFKVVDAEKADLVVVDGQRTNAELVNFYRGIGVPVLILDLPPIRWIDGGDSWRGVFAGQVGAIPEGLVDPARAIALGLRVQEPATRSPRVDYLVVGQVPNDAGHGLTAEGLAMWLLNAIDRIREIAPDASIAFRPHPLAPDSLQVQAARANENLEVWSAAEPLDHAIAGAGTLVVLTSTVQFRACALGVDVLRIDADGKVAGEIVDTAGRAREIAAAALATFSLGELASGIVYRQAIAGVLKYPEDDANAWIDAVAGLVEPVGLPADGDGEDLGDGDGLAEDAPQGWTEGEGDQGDGGAPAEEAAPKTPTTPAPAKAKTASKAAPKSPGKGRGKK